ncbi:MAG: helix-turn-helix domain-containing protein [Bryobacterales bacterium]|nr:helix-turn-helix domain-containing protein [Bryobacterales bacterium]
MMLPQNSCRQAARNIRLNLSAAREKAGLSIAQIAEATKISSRFLRAVEEETFAELPGGIFATSYIRQYADAIGADPDEILGIYYEYAPEAASAGKATTPPGAGRNGTKDAGRVSWLRWFGLPAATSRP